MTTSGFEYEIPIWAVTRKMYSVGFFGAWREEYPETFQCLIDGTNRAIRKRLLEIMIYGQKL